MVIEHLPPHTKVRVHVQQLQLVKELHSETALPCTWKGALLKQQHLLDFRTNTEHLQQKYGK
jgi:hypothetical protein